MISFIKAMRQLVEIVRISFNKQWGNKETSTRQKAISDTDLPPATKMNSIWSTELHVNLTTIKLLEDTMRENLEDHRWLWMIRNKAAKTSEGRSVGERTCSGLWSISQGNWPLDPGVRECWVYEKLPDCLRNGYIIRHLNQHPGAPCPCWPPVLPAFWAVTVLKDVHWLLTTVLFCISLMRQVPWWGISFHRLICHL